MLRNTMGMSFGWALALFGGAVLFVPACGGTGETGGGRCTPNQQVACACPGDKEGVQVCLADGSGFDLCQCEDGAGGSAGSSTGSSNGGTGAGGSGQQGACGDGAEDQGECDVGSENYCPEDCSGSSSSGTGGTGGDPCEGHVTYAGMVTNVASAWGQHPQAGGATGYEAGINICATLGADHPCDYEELKMAAAAGELSTVAQGTNAWVHRITDEMVDGAVSMPGAGGRCNDWVYTTNHISDGEYVTFDQVGVPTYHLDGDTFYNGVDTSHTITGDLQCGGQMRALFCCFPTCTP